VNDATAIPGTTEVVVTSEDGNNISTYSVIFDFEPLVPVVTAPIPTQEPEDVVSIFSDSYDDLAGTNFTPGWGQTTVVTFEDIGGNSMMKYSNFDYQGTQLAGNTDLSLMEYVHIDMWSLDATVVEFTPVSATTGEYLLPLDPITPATWVSYDIPLSEFVDMTFGDIHQLKIICQNGVSPSTIYLDNIYFYKLPYVAGTDATLSDLLVDGTTVTDFSPSTLSYEIELPIGTVTVPTVTAVTNDVNAEYVVTDATAIPGTTEVVVTSEDGSNVITYSVNFIFEPAVPIVEAPVPEQEPEDVISLFSNAYTNVLVDTWSAEWDDADVENVQINGDDVKLYTNVVYAGIEFGTETIDATGMDHFHMDIWTPDPTAAPAIFKIKLVDFGADGEYGGGDDVKHEITFDETTLATEEWVGLDIPFSDLTGLITTGHLAQLIFTSDPNTVYVDNVYFYDSSVGIVDELASLTSDYVLSSNYPNPFNPTTTIDFALKKAGNVSLQVFDTNGQLVKTLINGNLTPNFYKTKWNATNENNSLVASGIYFYRLKVNNKIINTRSMVLLK